MDTGGGRIPGRRAEREAVAAASRRSWDGGVTAARRRPSLGRERQRGASRTAARTHEWEVGARKRVPVVWWAVARLRNLFSCTELLDPLSRFSFRITG